MGRYLDESDLARMGYVCTECGKVSNILKSCPKGCTRICQDCLREKGYSFVFCKKCGDMTLQSWKGTKYCLNKALHLGVAIMKL